MYLALFPAIFALVVRRCVAAFGPMALMAAPVVWVATELGRTYIFTGFPWVLLGYSQVTVLPIAQLASLFGVYGVSMLVASVSAALATASDREPGTCVLRRLGSLLVVLALVVGVAVWGSRRAARRGVDARRRADSRRSDSRQHRPGGEVEIRRAPARSFDDYLRMSRQAIA